MDGSSTGTTIVDRVLGENIPYVTYAIPFFLLLIGIEIVFSLLAGRKVYRVNDSVTDLSCGVLDQTFKLFVEVIVLGAYFFIYEHYRLFDIASWSLLAKLLAAVVLFFAVDFCFYWHHRFGHEWAAGWATHAVHHQSEEFNLIVALRQSTFEHHLVFFFYLPLAWLGFPPAWYLAMFSFNLIWQFWVHTRLVGKLGPVEWVMVTPSHHRVHHARNPKYLDKNYGGTLIIWDRLFGTYAEEEEEPVYGITKPIKSFNPFWANWHIWYELGREAWYAPYWLDKIRVWFMPLGWTPRGLMPTPDPPEVTADTANKYDVAIPRGLMVYGIVHFSFAMIIALLFLGEGAQHVPLARMWDLMAMALFSLLTIGGVFELRRWVPPLELVRLALIPALAWNRLSGTEWLGYGMAAAILFSLFSAGVIISYRWSFRTSGADDVAVTSTYHAPQGA